MRRPGVALKVGPRSFGSGLFVFDLFELVDLDCFSEIKPTIHQTHETYTNPVITRHDLWGKA
jgi:hypothetical protein